MRQKIMNRRRSRGFHRRKVFTFDRFQHALTGERGEVLGKRIVERELALLD